MERIRHIRETDSFDDSNKLESDSLRAPICQHDVYDPATETTPEQIKVREYLDSIDEGVLRDIFAEYFRKSGAADASMNWISFAEVRILYKTPEEEQKSKSPCGSYSIPKGVQLYSHMLSHDPEKTLWTLIHEQCHAISQDRMRSYALLDDNGAPTEKTADRVMTGVKTITWTKETTEGQDGPEFRNAGINEGITELLTERIFKEYKKRSGSEEYGEHPLDEEKSTAITDWTIAQQKFDAYERYWQNAKMYIGIISALTDVPKDVVEESIIRTYVRNGSIVPFDVDTEINEVLTDINPELPKILLNMLKSEKDQSPSLRTYVDHINSKDIPDELRGKIIAALQEVREEWGEAYKLAPYEV